MNLRARIVGLFCRLGSKVEFRINGFNLDMSTSFDIVDCLVEEGLSRNGFSFGVLLHQFFTSSPHDVLCA